MYINLWKCLHIMLIINILQFIFIFEKETLSETNLNLS